MPEKTGAYDLNEPEFSHEGAVMLALVQQNIIIATGSSLEG